MGLTAGPNGVSSTFAGDRDNGTVDAVVSTTPADNAAGTSSYVVEVPEATEQEFSATLRGIADTHPGRAAANERNTNNTNPEQSETEQPSEDASPKDSSSLDTPTSDRPTDQKLSEGQPEPPDSPEPSNQPLNTNRPILLKSQKGSGSSTPSKDNSNPTNQKPPPTEEEPLRDKKSSEPKSPETDPDTADRKKSSTATPTPMPPTGLNAADLRKWFENNVQREPAPSPNGPLKQVEMISWMQVPQILKELESGNSRIRLNFPDIIPANPEMAAEQEEVREFLANHAGSELKDINAEVTAKIAGCVLFRTQTPAFTAEEYVQQFGLDLNNADKLRVCDVVRVTDAFKPTQKGEANMRTENKKGRDIILSTIEEGLGKTNEFRSFVIEVTAQNKDIFRQQLRGRYDSLPEPKPDTTKTKIWVAESFSPGATVEEFEFLAFIEEQGTGPIPAPRKEEEKEDDSGTPPVTKPTTSTKTEDTDEDTPAPTPPQSRRDGKRSRGSLVLGASS